MDTALGNGASGVVVAAKFEDRDVAMKIFTAETSPDGHARDEIAVTCHIDHPNLIKVAQASAGLHCLDLIGCRHLQHSKHALLCLKQEHQSVVMHK